MINLYHKVFKYFSESIHDADVLRFFRKCIYLILLYQTIILCLPIAEWLWSSDSWIATARYKNAWPYRFYMALHDNTFGGFYPLLLILQIAALLVGLTNKFTRLVSIIIYVTTVLLFNRVFLMHTGGNYLLHIFLFFLMFINENGKKQGSNAILSNLFSWALKIQIVIVYLFSAAFKLKGEVWQQGETLHYLLNMQEYSLPFLVGNLEGVTILLKVLTYASLLYQILFPFLVWIKKIKSIVLLIGVVFHLLTIVLQGVPVFGLVMIASYVLFLSSEQLSRMLSVFRVRKKKSISRKYS